MIKKDKVFTNDKKSLNCSQMTEKGMRSQMTKKYKVFTNDEKRIKYSPMIQKG